MKRTIEIFDGASNDAIGVLHYDRQGARENAAFEYRSPWLTHKKRFPLEPALPLVPGPQFHRKAPGGSIFHSCIADTEPDGWGRRIILREHAKRRRSQSRSDAKSANEPLGELDFLLAVDDISRVGALRFKDEHGVFLGGSPDSQHRIPPLLELEKIGHATIAFERNTESYADLEYLLGRGTSLGGMRPKCSVRDIDGRLAIGKFPSISDERDVTRAEVLALQLAKKAGICAAEARCVMAGDIPVAVIRRFDRTDTNARIMYVSAATLLGAEQAGEEHSYTDIVDAIRQYGLAPQQDIEELWRRIAFSILITNVDDHLHNHGFLHYGAGHWRLSPAFDLNPFPERHRELKLWLSEDLGPEAKISGLLHLLPYFRIAKEQAQTILRQVDAAVETWRTIGMQIGMGPNELDAFENAFEHQERDEVKRFLTGK